MEEELQYWKNKYKSKVKELKELEETFNEFQVSTNYNPSLSHTIWNCELIINWWCFLLSLKDSSKDLEGEMEREIERSEKQVKELTSSNRKIKDEFEEFKVQSK